MRPEALIIATRYFKLSVERTWNKLQRIENHIVCSVGCNCVISSRDLLFNLHWLPLYLFLNVMITRSRPSVSKPTDSINHRICLPTHRHINRRPVYARQYKNWWSFHLIRLYQAAIVSQLMHLSRGIVNYQFIRSADSFNNFKYVLNTHIFRSSEV